jgi:hypothetical protein
MIVYIVLLCICSPQCMKSLLEPYILHYMPAPNCIVLVPTADIIGTTNNMNLLLNYDQFTVLCANTCQFYKFTFKIFKILKFLKVLEITTCFGQYGHPQVLKSSGGNCFYCLLLHVSFQFARVLCLVCRAPYCSPLPA